MKRKVCVVVTARPSYSRVKTALVAIQKHPDLELLLVVAASALLDRYGNAIKVIERDGFKPAAKVFMVLEGENPLSMAKTTGLGVLELASVFDSIRPDVVVSVADRYETLATAVASSYMNIPLAHIQGGEVTGNIDEKVRHAVTKLADVHFVCTDLSRQRVIKMGENPELVFNTGCPSIDIASEVLSNSELNFDPIAKYGGVGTSVDISKGYVVVMQHPVTTEYEDSRQNVLETLFAVNELKFPVLWFWPNVDAGSDACSKAIRSFREEYKPSHIHFFKNMEPSDFLRLLVHSKCIIGNSSVALRECAFLGVPAINIGVRQSGRERGHNVIDVDYRREEIQAALTLILNSPRPQRDLMYGEGKAGEKIAELLATVPLGIDKRLSY